jgi:hypothetical protein
MTEYDWAMATWYVDKGLGTLISQEKRKHPGLVVGTIGDEAHRKRKSAHNPEADGSVDAGDFMLGKAFTKANADAMTAALVEHWDKRLHLIIWNRRQISEDNRKWRPYTLSDPHTGHAHIEVNDKHETDNSPWNLGGKQFQYEELGGFGLPILTAGMDDADYDGYNGVVRAQAMLNVQGQKLKLDGVYGPLMVAAVRAEFGGDGKRIDRPFWVKLNGLSRSV